MRLSILATAISLSLVGLSIADNVQAAMKKQTNIPAQGLGPALQAFARDRNLQIVYVSEEVNDLRTAGVVGDVTADEALRQLLDGTELDYRYLDDKTVTVFPVGQARASGGGRTEIGSSKEETTESRNVTAPEKQSFWQRLRLAQLDQRPAPTSSMGVSDGKSAKRIEVEEIVVTGTHLRNAEPITPVITLTRDLLIKQGYTRLDQALEKLPQNFKGAVAQDSNGITGAGVNSNNNYSFSTGVNLRGLGPTATLVLLNGRRLAPTATGQSVDISQIPISVIERVEVLADGASATYGSDAVAGVVNVITRKSFAGVEAGLRATGIADGKDPNYGSSITGGFDWLSGNAVVNVDYEKDRPLLTSDRSFTASVPGPTTLYPEHETTSAYASLGQTLGARSSISADVLASRREFLASSRLFTTPDSKPGTADQIHGAIQLDYAISADWTASIIGQFGEEKDEYESTRARLKQSFRYETYGGEARASGAVAELPGGSLRAAFGVSNRGESLASTAVNSSLGDADAQRQVKSAYGEVLIPIVSEDLGVPLIRKLRLDIAARYDDYDDFGSTSNPKFALQWALSDGLSLHGSYARSFRAPTLYSLDADVFYAAYVFPVTDPGSSSGVSPTLLLDGNNPDLSAERAKSLNVGLTFSSEDPDGFKTDISYFSIDYDGRITNLINEGFFTNVIQQAPVLGSLINLNPTQSEIDGILNGSGRTIYSYLSGFCEVGTPGCVVDPTVITAIANVGNVNVGSSRVRGLDGSVHYGRATSWGTASVDAAASYLVSYDNQLLPARPEFSIVNRVYNPLRLRAKIDFGLSSNAWSANARINYANSYNNANDPSCAAPGCSVASWTTVDFSASYTPSTRLDGTRFTFDVANVFDKDPPYVYERRGINYDGANANPLGRAFGVTVSKRWGAK